MLEKLSLHIYYMSKKHNFLIKVSQLHMILVSEQKRLMLKKKFAKWTCYCQVGEISNQVIVSSSFGDISPSYQTGRSFGVFLRNFTLFSNNFEWQTDIQSNWIPLYFPRRKLKCQCVCKPFKHISNNNCL